MGLKRGIVILEEYNPNWEIEFEKEKNNLKSIFRDVAISIEHVGSTSIKGLSAKPIIDISLGVNKLSDFDKVKEHYLNNNEYKIKENYEENEILLIKGPEEDVTNYIHIMEINGDRYKDTILFRNYLRNNKIKMKEYEDLKKKLAKEYPLDRRSYTSLKNDFIKSTITEAKKEKLGD